MYGNGTKTNVQNNGTEQKTQNSPHLYAGQEATDRTGHGTTDWFQIGKGYVKAVYYHPACLTYMQSTS